MKTRTPVAKGRRAKKPRTWPKALIYKMIDASWSVAPPGYAAEGWSAKRSEKGWAGDGARAVLDMLVREGWLPPRRAKGRRAG